MIRSPAVRPDWHVIARKVPDIVKRPRKRQVIGLRKDLGCNGV
jgi:hypothetical protein